MDLAEDRGSPPGIHLRLVQGVAVPGIYVGLISYNVSKPPRLNHVVSRTSMRRVRSHSPSKNESPLFSYYSPLNLSLYLHSPSNHDIEDESHSCRLEPYAVSYR